MEKTMFWVRQIDPENTPKAVAEIFNLNSADFWRKVENDVVKQGYESPYAFGKKLRELIGDDNAPIFKFFDGPIAFLGGKYIYFAIDEYREKIAFYNPKGSK